MRDLYCYDQLDADRRKALNDIGFVWKPPIVELSKTASKDSAKRDPTAEFSGSAEDVADSKEGDEDSQSTSGGESDGYDGTDYV